MRELVLGITFIVIGLVSLFAGGLSVRMWWMGKPIAYVVGRKYEGATSYHSYPIYRDGKIGHAINRCIEDGNMICELPKGTFTLGEGR